MLKEELETVGRADVESWLLGEAVNRLAANHAVYGGSKIRKLIRACCSL